MPKKPKYDEETKVIGIRVPKSKFEAMKKPLREFADYYVNDGICLKDILKENEG